ncbi:MAG TPA: inositol monophosphatase family protein [Deinococcales bacterium]|nr:inositol monophosphatase family protein [Deinococcales bacterium]
MINGNPQKIQAELDRYVQFTMRTAQDAGRVTLRWFMNEMETDVKADESPVTAADLAAEELIRARLERELPEHDIVGEEHGEQLSGSLFRWFVDPIDGTKAFMRGVPTYAVLMGLEVDGYVEAGIVHFPALGETLWARSGSGTFFNGRRVRVSRVADLADATLAFTDVNTFREFGRQEAFDRLCARTLVRAGWTDAYGHALVASGRIELMLDPVMNAWDCGPFPVLLREAGGYFGSWAGDEGIHHGEALSTTEALKDEVLGVIAGRG